MTRLVFNKAHKVYKAVQSGRYGYVLLIQLSFLKNNFGPDAGCDKTHYVNESLHFFPSRSFDFHPKLKEKNELVKIS